MASEHDLTSKATAVLTSATFQLHEMAEASAVANFLALFCKNPRLAAVGISELIVNAIEHGNLGITFEEKAQFKDQVSWLKEVNRRVKLPENKHKKVTVFFEKEQNIIRIKVSDEGNGFNWRNLQALNPDSTSRLKTHGRGITLAKELGVFTSLTYSEKGNEVVAELDCGGRTQGSAPTDFAQT